MAEPPAGARGLISSDPFFGRPLRIFESDEAASRDLANRLPSRMRRNRRAHPFALSFLQEIAPYFVRWDISINLQIPLQNIRLT